jgi:hypothetical protein
LYMAKSKGAHVRMRAQEQALVLRVLAERIEKDSTPLPPSVFAPLQERVAENDELPPDAWEKEWTAEIEQRVRRVLSGKTKRIPAQKVIEEALAIAATRR